MPLRDTPRRPQTMLKRAVSGAPEDRRPGHHHVHSGKPAPIHRHRIHRQRAACCVALRSVGKTSLAAVVQLPQKRSRTAAHWRPTPALAAGRHSARSLAAGIQHRPDRSPARAGVAGGAGASAGGVAARHLRGAAHHPGDLAAAKPAPVQTAAGKDAPSRGRRAGHHPDQTSLLD